jgi:hypothetical protein
LPTLSDEVEELTGQTPSSTVGAGAVPVLTNQARVDGFVHGSVGFVLYADAPPTDVDKVHLLESEK